jgi:hypothetical protein
VLVVAAIFGGVLFYFRRKRAQEDGIQEIGTRNDVKDMNGMSFGSAASGSAAAAAAAEKGGDRPSMWAPDSRMDSGTAQQRMSTGSIADNQDFSRRILQVCGLVVSRTIADCAGAKPGRVLVVHHLRLFNFSHPPLHHPPTREPFSTGFASSPALEFIMYFTKRC